MTSRYTRDAIIYNEREVNAMIWRIRNGKNPSPRTISLYREHVQALSALLVALEQQEGQAGWVHPLPYGQIVGVVDPAEKRRLGWRGWFRSFERAAVPFHYSIAAE